MSRQMQIGHATSYLDGIVCSSKETLWFGMMVERSGLMNEERILHFAVDSQFSSFSVVIVFFSLLGLMGKAVSRE